MNFNRLVKRYHVEVRELAVPSDEEVQARKVERIVTRLAAEGLTLPLEDFAEFGPVARRIVEHEHRERILAPLLRGHFQAPARGGRSRTCCRLRPRVAGAIMTAGAGHSEAARGGAGDREARAGSGRPRTASLRCSSLAYDEHAALLAPRDAGASASGQKRSRWTR